MVTVRHASLARLAANSQQHVLCIVLCCFLFTDINGLPECLKYATARMFADDTIPSQILINLRHAFTGKLIMI